MQICLFDSAFQRLIIRRCRSKCSMTGLKIRFFEDLEFDEDAEEDDTEDSAPVD